MANESLIGFCCGQENNTLLNYTWSHAGVHNGSDPPGGQGYTGAGTAVSPLAQFIVNGVVVPAIGVLGVLGNLLNLAILSWRSWKKEDDTLEKVALVGLISLAVSDMCFCITVLPGFVCWNQPSFDSSRSFSLLYRAYGGYLQNVFIKTSTWLTMIVATARYVAICHPLRARICFSLTPTKAAILFTYTFWALLLLPLLWEFQILEYTPVNRTTVYVIDFGSLYLKPALHTTCVYVWAIVGYFLPVSILAYCNVCLIQALRESQRLRESVANRSIRPSARHGSRRITLTLVMLVAMFFLLISPSELLYFCNQITPDIYSAYELAVLFTNVLQAINFALHFVLYVIVNVTFRRTLVNLGFYLLALVQSSRLTRHAKSRESFSRRSTFAHSALRSNETHI